MTDGYIQVATDGAGKKVDASEIVNPVPETAVTLERQRVVLSDPVDLNAHVNVTGESGRGAGASKDVELQELIRELIGEIREIKSFIMGVMS
jgi:hypothetical protein